MFRTRAWVPGGLSRGAWAPVAEGEGRGKLPPTQSVDHDAPGLLHASFFVSILMSFFDRLGVDLGSVLGVIFGRFGALVGQSWSQDRL